MMDDGRCITPSYGNLTYNLSYRLIVLVTVSEFI